MQSSKFTFLHLWGAFNIAISYPLLYELSRSPEFFIARRHLPVDVVSLVIILCFGIPAVLILVEWFVFRSKEIHGRILHGFLLAFFLIAWVLINIRRVNSMPGLVALPFAIFFGVTIIWGYFKLPLIRYFLNYFSVMVLLVPVIFLINPSIRKVLRNTSSFLPTYTVDSKVPVVMVIFDEMPLLSLMNEKGEIDKQLFPNFFAFAETSYWFRNATTIYDYTVPSITAILTGKTATNPLARFIEYPNNLFTLLGQSYDLRVFESATQLCPGRLSDEPYSQRMKLLFEDLSAIYLNLVVPKDFSHNLPDITRNWKHFWGSSRRNSPSDDRQYLFQTFLKSIQPSDQPTLYFVHVALPHTPWEHFPDGKRYYANLNGSFNWDMSLDHPWAATQALQRHLLSMRFMDHLVGRLIYRLKQYNLFDRALVIITSDHGISFHSGSHGRFVNSKNYPEIAYIPLFIKLPNQKNAIRSERNIQSIDIVPTIADVLKVRLPWEVNGMSVLQVDSSEPAKKIIYHSREVMHSDKRMLNILPVPIPLHNENELLNSVRKNREMLGSSDLFRIGPNHFLIGQPISKLKISGNKDVDIVIYNQEKFEKVDLQSSFLPAMITGKLGRSNSLALGIVLNGTLAATTWTIPYRDSQIFSAILPESFFHSGRNTLSVLWFPQEGKPEAVLLQ